MIFDNTRQLEVDSHVWAVALRNESAGAVVASVLLEHTIDINLTGSLINTAIENEFHGAELLNMILTARATVHLTLMTVQ